MRNYKDFVEYVRKNYSGARKIVEVGVGKDTRVLEGIAKGGEGEIFGTDIEPAAEGDVVVLKDDLLEPKLELYSDSALIYSIRPPPELLPYIEELAYVVGADLIIRPLVTDNVEECSFFKSRKLVNYKGAAFYLFRR